MARGGADLPGDRGEPEKAGAAARAGRAAGAKTKAMVDRAVTRGLDPVFEELPIVHTADEAHELLRILQLEEAGPGKALAGTAALIATARPVLLRLATGAGYVSRLARFTVAGRALAVGAAAAAGGARLSRSGKRALNELQVLAMLLRSRARAAGIELSRPDLERLAIGLYLDPKARGPLPAKEDLLGGLVRRGLTDAARKEASGRRTKARFREAAELTGQDIRDLLG